MVDEYLPEAVASVSRLRMEKHDRQGSPYPAAGAGQSGISDSCARYAPDDALFQSSAFSYNQLVLATSFDLFCVTL